MTPARQRVLKFIEGFIDKKGYAPTYDEIRIYVGGKSRSVIWLQVQALARDGFIEFDRHPSGVVKWRGIRVVSGPCPRCGHVANVLAE